MPYFLITIDTEGDNLWRSDAVIHTENVHFLPPFQQLCESYGFKPTYLTDYRMGSNPAFVEFGRNALKAGAEIGMHLHAWDTPPFIGLTENDSRFRPYLIEYPLDVMEQKITTVTELLQDRFGTRMASHRAGRWSFDERYARILVEKGYKVDCSVTPFISWRRNSGNPTGKGGSDYSDFPNNAYFVDLADIRRRGHSPLLEVPVTICAPLPVLARIALKNSEPLRWAHAAVQRIFPARWLRPNGQNGEDMLGIVRDAAQRGSDYVEFMLHSSELMPGGSPTFPRAEDTEALYSDLNVLFKVASQHFQGATLQQYYDVCSAQGRVN